jgi:uncharacterized damage-inducible protein DinB
MNSATDASTVPVITADELLKQWQGHRRLTRRVIEAFPDDEALFHYSVGGMRPFAGLIMEFISMAVPIVRGVATGTWTSAEAVTPATRSELLRLWDEDTAEIDRLWPSIPPHRFQEVDTAFGQWKMTGYEMILYGIDNEIHHRGQGYVYLRALGIEPPAFYDRS